MGKGKFGSCLERPPRPLRWDADADLAEAICCHSRDGAEAVGTWLAANLPRALSKQEEQLTFYDSVSGEPLFAVPGKTSDGNGQPPRSYADFFAESEKYGYLSFRDGEVLRPHLATAGELAMSH